jgi:hypothetical protein
LNCGALERAPQFKIRCCRKRARHQGKPARNN